MKFNRKRLAILVGSVAGVIGLTAGILAVVANSGKKPVYVYSYDITGMRYMEDSQQTYGPVRSDNIQTVMLSDTQTVTEIRVKEGDTVKKDQVLMTFDSTLSELALEKKRLAVEQLKLRLQQEKERLQEINNLIPYTPAPKKDAGWVGGTSETMFTGTQVFIPDDTTSAVHWKGGLGTSEADAVIMWMRSGEKFSNEMLDVVARFLKKARSQWILENYNQQYAAYEDALEKYGQETGDGEQTFEKPQAPVKPDTQNIRDFYVILKQAEGDTTASAAQVYFGMHAYWDDERGWVYIPFNASGVPDYTKTGSGGYWAEEDKNEDAEGIYTLEEIIRMRQEQQKTILDVEYKIKLAEAEYSIAQRETQDGSVRSEVDGKVISVLTPEEAKEQKQPVIKVSGGGGYYVVGTVSELERDQLAIGSEVTIADNRTGNVCTGIVESIGDYPTGDGRYGGENENASYYPFNVFVDESADLVGGSYVNISYTLEESGSGIYLTNAFLRKENGQNYVYVRGADGKLEKRAVTVGKTLWGSYKEIRSGVTAEDMIAFPYGKNVRVGADTQVGDYTTLSGM